MKSDWVIDLESYVSKVRNIDARKLLSEAVAAYNAGAYRACIVTVWLSVVVDLLYKFEDIKNLEGEAANSDVKAVVQSLSSVFDTKDQKAAINKMHALENDILNKAKSAQLISDIEWDRLNRIKKERDLCAHPSISGVTLAPYDPINELCRWCIVEAVSSLLSHYPMLGKKHASRIVEIVGSDIFPENEEDAYNFLKGDWRVKSLNESALRSTVDLCLKKLLYEKEETSVFHKKYVSALYACSKIHTESFNDIFVHLFEKIFGQALDSGIWSIALLGVLEHTFEIGNEGDGIFEKMSLYIDGMFRFKDISDQGVDQKCDLLKHMPKLFSAFKYKPIEEAFFRALDAELPPSFEVTLFNDLDPHEKMCDLYVKWFGSSRNFDESNSIYMPTVKKWAAVLNEEQLDQLLEKIINNTNLAFAFSLDAAIHCLYKTCKFDKVWAPLLDLLRSKEDIENKSQEYRNRWRIAKCLKEIEGNPLQ